MPLIDSDCFRKEISNWIEPVGSGVGAGSAPAALASCGEEGQASEKGCAGFGNSVGIGVGKNGGKGGGKVGISD